MFERKQYKVKQREACGVVADQLTHTRRIVKQKTSYYKSKYIFFSTRPIKYDPRRRSINFYVEAL